MIRSMTGFGHAEIADEGFTVTVEARSVNHRHLDLALRLPAALAGLEAEARRLVQSRIERGRIDVAVQVEPVTAPGPASVRVDTELARRYVDEARALAADLGLVDDVGVGWILGRPGVMVTEETAAPDADTTWPLVREALARALDELTGRRAAEGAMLGAELRALGAELGALLPAMAARAPLTAARRTERLRERMRSMLGEAGIDEARIVAEVAAWATKTDVTEELARLRAHLEEFGLKLDKGGPMGRPLDFLIQEMHREVNTIGAKADDLELSQAALAAKGVLEKIREQIQNLE
jgi:uncharacterized protein (TIGR00255 family)